MSYCTPGPLRMLTSCFARMYCTSVGLVGKVDVASGATVIGTGVPGDGVGLMSPLAGIVGGAGDPAASVGAAASGVAVTTMMTGVGDAGWNAAQPLPRTQVNIKSNLSIVFPGIQWNGIRYQDDLRARFVPRGK